MIIKYETSFVYYSSQYLQACQLLTVILTSWLALIHCCTKHCCVVDSRNTTVSPIIVIAIGCFQSLLMTLTVVAVFMLNDYGYDQMYSFVV